jgi:probable phosphoglycerate mutase
MEEGRLHGVKDSPLSDQGKSEAQATANFLSQFGFGAFYTSPLGRAVETAEILSTQLGIAPKHLVGLQERDFGIMEGRPHFGDVKLPRAFKPIYLAMVAGLITVTGEPRSKFKKRVIEAAKYIATQHPDQKVLAVVHTAVQSHLIASVIEAGSRGWLKYNDCPPCGITEVEIFPNGTGRLLKFGSDAHLLSS